MPDATAVRRILYIVTGPPVTDFLPLIVQGNSGEEVSVCVVDPSLDVPDSAGCRVYALEGPPETGRSVSRHPTMSYADLLRRIFDSDRVIVL